jgi:hypothetical protein
MKLGPDGGGEAEVLATQVDGVPGGGDVDQTTCDVYFTESSTTAPPNRADLV